MFSFNVFVIQSVYSECFTIFPRTFVLLIVMQVWTLWNELLVKVYVKKLVGYMLVYLIISWLGIVECLKKPLGRLLVRSGRVRLVVVINYQYLYKKLTHN